MSRRWILVCLPLLWAAVLASAVAVVRARHESRTLFVQLERIVADLQLFAVHAQDTAMRVLIPEDLRPEMPAMTPRELEVLREVLRGAGPCQRASRLAPTPALLARAPRARARCTRRRISLARTRARRAAPPARPPSP